MYYPRPHTTPDLYFCALRGSGVLQPFLTNLLGLSTYLTCSRREANTAKTPHGRNDRIVPFNQSRPPQHCIQKFRWKRLGRKGVKRAPTNQAAALSSAPSTTTTTIWHQWLVVSLQHYSFSFGLERRNFRRR